MRIVCDMYTCIDDFSIFLFFYFRSTALLAGLGNLTGVKTFETSDAGRFIFTSE